MLILEAVEKIKSIIVLLCLLDKSIGVTLEIIAAVRNFIQIYQIKEDCIISIKI